MLQKILYGLKQPRGETPYLLNVTQKAYETTDLEWEMVFSECRFIKGGIHEQDAVQQYYQSAHEFEQGMD